jgi:hypothetical protein
VAKAGQKTKQCNYCGIVVDLWMAQKIADASSAREALRVVQDFKMKHGKFTR